MSIKYNTMNFKDVISLTIPQGEVIQIQDNLSRILWKKNTIDYSEPFWVENLSESIADLTIGKSNQLAPSINIDYSFDGEDWQYLGDTGDDVLTLTLNEGEKVYLRASVSSWAYYNQPATYYNAIDMVEYGGGSQVEYGIGGNILSLLYGGDFNGQSTFISGVGTHTFYGLFDGTLLMDASKLILPTNTVANCYRSMFNNCSNLNAIQCLATDISASNCLYYWVGGVAASGTFIKRVGVTFPSGVSGIPNNWTVESV